MSAIGKTPEPPPKITAESPLRSDAEEFGSLLETSPKTLPKTLNAPELDFDAAVEEHGKGWTDPLAGTGFEKEKVTRAASQVFNQQVESGEEVNVPAKGDPETDQILEGVRAQKTDGKQPVARAASQVFSTATKEKPEAMTERHVTWADSPPASATQSKGLLVLGGAFAKFGALLSSGKDRVVSALQKFGEAVRETTRKCCENIKLPERDKVDAAKMEKKREEYQKMFNDLFKGEGVYAPRLVEIMQDDSLRAQFLELVKFTGGNPKKISETVDAYRQGEDRLLFADPSERTKELMTMQKTVFRDLNEFVEKMYGKLNELPQESNKVTISPQKKETEAAAAPQESKKVADVAPKEKTRESYQKLYEELFEGYDELEGSRLVEIMGDKELKSKFLELVKFTGANSKEIAKDVKAYEKAETTSQLQKLESYVYKMYKDLYYF